MAGCKGRTLFELDCARRRQITGMIAVFHGPSLDDGVCMETGFAAALGVPVVLVTTDLQTYAPAPGGPGSVFADPLPQAIAAAVVRAHRLGPPDEHAAGDRFHRFHRFLAQNLAPVRAATAQAVNALLGAAREPPPTSTTPDGGTLAYLEPSPYITDDMWTAIARELRARRWRVHTAQRLTTGTGTAEAARADWAAATSLVPPRPEGNTRSTTATGFPAPTG